MKEWIKSYKKEYHVTPVIQKNKNLASYLAQKYEGKL